MIVVQTRAGKLNQTNTATILRRTNDLEVFTGRKTVCFTQLQTGAAGSTWLAISLTAIFTGNTDTKVFKGLFNFTITTSFNVGNPPTPGPMGRLH